MTIAPSRSHRGMNFRRFFATIPMSWLPRPEFGPEQAVCGFFTWAPRRFPLCPAHVGTFHTNLFSFKSEVSFSAIVGSLPLTSASSDGGYRSSAILSKCSLDDTFADEVRTFFGEIRDRSEFPTRDQLKRYGIQYAERLTLRENLNGRQQFAGDAAVDEMMHVFRMALPSSDKNLGTVEFVKRVVQVLRRRGKTVGKKVKGQIEQQFCESQRRGLLKILKVHVRRQTTRLTDYEFPELVEAMIAVMHSDAWYKRDDVIGAVCQYLGFQRVTAGMEKHMRSALNSAVRGNVLFADGRLEVMRPYRPTDQE